MKIKFKHTTKDKTVEGIFESDKSVSELSGYKLLVLMRNSQMQ